MLNLEIYRLKENYYINKKALFIIFKRAANLLKLKNLKISLAIVDDKTIRKLNKKYRFRDKVTDVLSFDFSTPLMLRSKNKKSYCSSEVENLRSGGEIVISYSEAKRQSREYKESLQKTVSRLFVHGLLHIARYEHKTKADKARMGELEERLST